MQYGLPLIPKLDGTLHHLEAADSTVHVFMPIQQEIDLFRVTCSDMLVDVVGLGFDTSTRHVLQFTSDSAILPRLHFYKSPAWICNQLQMSPKP